MLLQQVSSMLRCGASPEAALCNTLRAGSILVELRAKGDAWPADAADGPHERNVLDFYRAPSDKPTPLVVHIHGGGFVAGNKNLSPGQVKAFHGNRPGRPRCRSWR
jgi:acetyl esterase/lipase